MGKLRCFKETQINRFPTKSYSCLPCSAFVFSNTKKRRCIAGWSRFILAIFKIMRFTKIAYSVVISIAVYVIQKLIRPLPVKIKPRESVPHVISTVYMDVPISVGDVQRPGNAVFSYSSTSACDVGKNPGVRVVVEKFAQTLCGKIGLSHDALLMLIGQRPGSVSALSGLRYFSVICA